MQLEQSRAHFRVAVEGEHVQIDCAAGYSASEGQQSANLLVTEPQGAQTSRASSSDIARCWKCVVGGRVAPESHVGSDSKTIQKLETDNERELLAREGVHQRLEHGRKPRRFQTTEPMRQFSEPTITLCDSVPLGEIDVQSEQPFDN